MNLEDTLNTVIDKKSKAQDQSYNTIQQLIEKSQALRDASDERKKQGSPVERKMHNLTVNNKGLMANSIGFPEPIKISSKVQAEQKFVDHGATLTKEQRRQKANMPKNRGPLSIDPGSLSQYNSQQQSDIFKKFKLACLAFKPSRVVYRNIDFSREQLRIFRKFLFGQCSKIIHMKEPFAA